MPKTDFNVMMKNLHKDLLRSYLPYDMRERLAEIEILQQVNSTNDYLLAKTRAANGGFHACFAESQTHGKGRRSGRGWQSPPCGSIYMSVLRNCSGNNAAWLGLLVAMHVTENLRAMGGSEVGIKWPNDIYTPTGKLGGILAERKDNACVIGVGINLHVPRDLRRETAQVATLEEVMDLRVGRNVLAAMIVEAVVKSFDCLADIADTSALVQRFRRFDMLYEKPIEVSGDNQKPLAGVALGVTQAAALRVRHNDGIQEYDAAQVSVHL